MRVFFAIEFGNEVKEYFSKVQEEVREHCIGGNFTLKENFHLTLRFIGEQTSGQVETLKNALNQIKGFKPFELRLSKIGNFSRGAKKIIWIGLKRSSELDNLYNQLESVLESAGLSREERGYNPHITLAREARTEDFEGFISSFKVDDLSITVKSVSLMESTRINNKLSYLPIYKVDF